MKSKSNLNFRNKKPKVRNLNNNSNYFKEKYNSQFGDNTFNKLLESKTLYSKNQFIRVNLSKTTIEKVEGFLKKNNIIYSKTIYPNFFKIENSKFSLAASPEHLMGWFYIQDLASGTPVNIIDWKKEFSGLGRELKVLDLCASPGSKTTQLADTLNFLEVSSKIIAIEPQQKRLTRLINNIQKLKFTNVDIFQSKGEDLKLRDLNQDELFDVILVDAPCSGNLVGDFNWLNKRDSKGIFENSNIQKKILENAVSLLKKGGFLIYSTCSLEVEENEENVHFAIKKLGLKPQEIHFKFPFVTKPLLKNKGGNFDKEVSKSIRFMPYNSKTEGFFVSLFKK